MSDFDEFFRRATGHAPFAYQRRLATAAQWPDVLEVPTGAGKTAAAILGWLWRRRFGPPELRAATGRRLVICLPMRVLTTQTAQVARSWITAVAPADPPSVHVVMGGAVDDAWVERPEADAIIIGTQDMLLSRALNRGFAMSRYEWPMAFGLLHNDVQWVFDEVQLMGVGATTSAQQAALRDKLRVSGPHHSLWMTATFDPERISTVDRPSLGSVIQLDEADEALLAVRLDAKKSLKRSDVDGSDAPAVAKFVLQIHVPETRTIVVLNSVRRAQDLATELLKRAGEISIGLLHSRYRPVERDAIEREVLAPNWAGILVATQVIEAGVDVSARTMITELAPWASLVQRFGRCNRAGEFSEAAVWWIHVPERNAAPYEDEALHESKQRLESCTDVSARSLSRIAAVAASLALPVLRRRDVLDLFDTTPDLAGADVDVSVFIRDGDDTDVQVAWRSIDRNVGPEVAAPLPGRSELCGVPIGQAKDLLKSAGRGAAWRWDHRLERWTAVERAVPGQVWLVDATIGGYSPKIGLLSSSTVPVPVIPPADEAPAEGEGSDARSVARVPQSLGNHSDDVVMTLKAMIDSLPFIDENSRNSLLRAARWHDAGKVHPEFQWTMHGGDDWDGPPLAKSASQRRHRRRGLRHEVASAMLTIADAPSAFLDAYLVAAHHGRARLVVRARPGEEPAPDGRRFVLGIWDGDSLPAADIGAGITSPAMVIDTRLFDFGETNGSPGWSARAASLLEAHGPFRLAFLEALLRAADWRASARVTA